MRIGSKEGSRVDVMKETSVFVRADWKERLLSRSQHWSIAAGSSMISATLKVLYFRTGEVIEGISTKGRLVHAGLDGWKMMKQSQAS